MAAHLALYRRLGAYARPYRWHIAGILLLQLLSTPLALLVPLPLKIAVDTVIGSKPLPSWLNALLPGRIVASPTALLTVAAGILLGTALLGSLQELATGLLQTYTGEKLSQDFRSRLFRHVQRLSLSYYDTRGTSDSTYRIQYDAPSIQRVIVGGLIPLCGAAVTLVAMIYVTVRIDWRLAIVALSVSPVLFGLVRTFGPRLRTRWKEIKKLDSSAMGVVQEVLASVRVVKAFGREDREQDRFLEQSTRRVRREVDVAALQGAFDVFVGVAMAAGSAAALLIGVRQVRAGSLSLGNLLLVMAYLQQIYKPLKTLSKKTADLQSALASADRAFALLDELPEVSERRDAVRLARARGDLLFLDVSFAYEPDRPVLHRVSFAAPPGTRVGIRGTTGAGKSTLMGLLMRFYDPTGGVIRLDGVDLPDYHLGDLRRQFALVLQDQVLFSTSIGENIAYGREGASPHEVVEAARLANAYDFITALPDGFDTPVGERGMRLSGGERQRISLARAFLKDAPILILDEPTSSVDVKTEAVIMEAMQRLMQGRTTFMIAHRLDTLAVCDMQVELEKGWTVFETGELTMEAERFVFTANQRASSVLRVIGGARHRLVLSLFRCDDFRILDAIGAALHRGVDVGVLVTPRAKGWTRRLDELWGALESMGAALCRSADPVVKYHAKYLVADDGPALVASLNFTRRCFTSTCDFLLTTHDPSVVGGLRRLFAADSRGPESPPPARLGSRLIVGPEHARRALTGLLGQARRSIRIVDPKVTDPAILQLLKTKRAEGVEVTVLGRDGLRQFVPHGKMLLVDGTIGVLGSLSLSALSLDFRREVAVVVHDPQCLEQMDRVFRRLAGRPAPGRGRPVN